MRCENNFITLFNRLAVITAYEADVRSGTSQDSLVRFRLHEGTEAKIEDEQDHWLRILLPDEKQGWIERSVAVVVDL